MTVPETVPTMPETRFPHCAVCAATPKGRHGTAHGFGTGLCGKPSFRHGKIKSLSPPGIFSPQTVSTASGIVVAVPSPGSDRPGLADPSGEVTICLSASNRQIMKGEGRADERAR
jgi:hypothetical protein